MSRQTGAPPAILVTDANRGSAIAIIRSLGRRGWRVIAADSRPDSLGFHSRFVAGRVVYPDPQVDPPGMVAALLDAVRDHQVDLLVPVTDDVILPLSGAREQFAGACTIAMPERDQLEVVTNKLKTIELAQRLGVPVPATFMVQTVDDVRGLKTSLNWPVVVKPQVSRLYRDQVAVDVLEVTYARDLEHLLAIVRGFEGTCPVLLQEYCHGVGYGVELLAYQGRTLAAFQHRRLREVPVTGGASSFRESVALDPVLYDYSQQLLQALNWTGLAMVEFKVGPHAGPRLMEINGRVWGSLPLAVHSGMDFPARMTELYLSGPPGDAREPDTDYRLGVRSRDLEKDLVWIVKVLAGRQSYPFLPMPPRWRALTALLGLFNPRHRLDVQSLSDPVPGLVEVPKIVRKLVSKRQEVRQLQEATQ